MNFTVLLPVYFKDNEEYLKEAFDSILNQTVKADEILVLVDGEVGGDLINVLEYYKKEYSAINVKYFHENRGLGKVLNDGVSLAKHELIARMDSDDIALLDRFEKQIKCFEQEKNLTLIGGSIHEFETNADNMLKERRVPQTLEDIKSYSKFRNPFNHMTVMFKKVDILNVGNYLDMPLFEDYYLWVRVLNAGMEVKNLGDVLVNVRAGNEMVNKRSGLKYLKKEIKFQKKLLNMNYISVIEFIKNICLRGFPRLMPTEILTKLYNLLLRH